MRKLVLVALLILVPRAARADVGVGLFVGEPTAFDLKIDLANTSALDIAIGATSIRRSRSDSYGHVTYLVTPVAGHGRSVLIPLRLGIGAALMGTLEDRVRIGVRAPIEVGIKFRRTPIEIYFEVAFMIVLLDEADSAYFNLDGGVGLRFYF